MRHHDAGKTTRDILNARNVIKALKVRDGMILVDAGCGDGFISIEASKAIGSGRIYAIDIYEESINILKRTIKEENIGNIRAILGDITRKLPIPESTVDIYLMANVLHGLVANKRVKPVMEEIRRVLKPDGKLAIVEFKKESRVGPHPSLRLDPRETSDIIKVYGFYTVRVEDVGPYHYILVARMLV
ncbi:MAG TPA: class I SAM-dependent methyltransferase [Methanothermobacter sp.]|jgi:ubiquinone/menaquinone biosynthesis C-methylase UbiE|uniref:Methyltransferase n=1 Tax=Methanothermobacter tenebrarum TaxID=680118 RepID=A0ABM7YEI2_9EURY|nr:class I SAM-dependent methyltransferase [Methanothermobacter tenebrarum]MDD3455170.1 class I SAM-dependent methyltransferase [Methanobacteriales archaeon]MDI6881525.1 class I SAM-dependent methyltransferase [Methanothermobacter sp.]MDX9693063.1 class I SAM-dependent methyltransferase [Methanothermobacter sp.]BDH79801.1 methyltransferase [Methanothermobacter tenebrarum]HHW16707.1 class I SAM-dependent methyltransferase [Methanothermobacter sp.]